MIAGEHDLPHVRAAGSVGTALKSKKVITLKMPSMTNINPVRRIMYLNIRNLANDQLENLFS
jgi:hypothetical protein